MAVAIRVGRRGLAVAAAVAVAVAVAGCGTTEDVLRPAAGRAPIVVAAQVDSEADALVAELYAGALRRAGREVRVDTGHTGHAAPESAGGPDIITGSVSSMLTALAPGTATEGSEDTRRALAAALPPGVLLADPAPASVSPVVVVTTSTFRDGGLRGLSTLGPRCADMSAATAYRGGAVAAHRQALGEAADCSFRTGLGETGIAPAELAARLGDGRIDAAILPGLAPEAYAPGLAVVADDAGVFPDGAVVAAYRREGMGRAEGDELGVISGELTTADLAHMLAEIHGGRPRADVVAEWLHEHSL